MTTSSSTPPLFPLDITCFTMSNSEPGVKSEWWKVESGGWRVESGEWRTEGGRLRIENGGWEIENREWRMEGGVWRMEGGGWRVGKEENSYMVVGYIIESMHSKSLQAFGKGLHCVQIHYSLGPWF